MSRGIALEPVVSHTSTDKTAIPAPTLVIHAALDPVCHAYATATTPTATPDMPSS